MSKAIKISEHKDLGYEVFALWDRDAEVYELFLSAECDDYIGFAMSRADCKEVARQFYEEMMAG